MDKSNKKKYQYPQLTIVDIKVEHGYAISGLGIGLFNSESGTQNIESRDVSGGYLNNGNADTWF